MTEIYNDDNDGDELVTLIRRELAARRRAAAVLWTVLIGWLLAAVIWILLHPSWWGK